MTAESYDLIAIGAGPAGESAAELAAAFGHRAIIVEKDRAGGVVTTTGGVPTKTLREAAMFFTQFRDRDVYGVHMDAPPEIAAAGMRARTRHVCEALQVMTRANIEKSGVEYVEGVARLGPGGTVTLTEPGGARRELRGTAVLVATGSRPARPANVPFDHPGICDTDTVLARGWIPKSLVIVGGGAVAVEFATIAHALGARVTLVERAARLIATLDEELSREVAALFSAWGVDVRFGTTVDRVAVHGETIEASLSDGTAAVADTLLFAAGRRPNTEELGLEEAGVRVDPRGRIVVDARLRTSAERVYAAGDVLGATLASIAMEQGRAAVCDALGIPFEGVVDPTPVSAIYGMPEVAGAGWTEAQCRERNLDYEVGRADLGATPRGAINGRGGLLKLIFLRESRRIVGVHAICDIASEIVGIGQMAIRCGATLYTIANMSMSTPTYAHAYKYAAFDGLARAAARPPRPLESSAAPPR